MESNAAPQNPPSPLVPRLRIRPSSTGLASSPLRGTATPPPSPETTPKPSPSLPLRHCSGITLRLKNFRSLEEWVEEELRMHGGELFAVVPKSKNDWKKMEKRVLLNFKVISDPEDRLAQKYKISTPHQKRNKLQNLIDACMKHPPPPTTRCRSTSVPAPVSLSEMFSVGSRPGVVILSAKHRLEPDQWVVSRTIKNHYDMRENFTPASLNELLDLHFGRSWSGKFRRGS